MKKLTAKDLAAIGVGSALFFVLGRFCSIPTPVPTISIYLQYGLLAVLAVAYGPTAGALVGFIGHLLIDLSMGVHWWAWIVASAAFGALVGVLSNVVRLSPSGLDRDNLIRFNVIQLAVHVVCWAGIAPVLDIWWYAEPIDKLFDQGLTAALVNAVTTALVGTALMALNARIKAKSAAGQK